MLLFRFVVIHTLYIVSRCLSFSENKFVFCFLFTFIQGTDNIERFSSSPTKFWRAPAATICNTRTSSTSSHTTTAHDSKNIYVTEMVTRKKGVDDIEVESMSLSNSTGQTPTLFVLLLLQMISFGFVVT